MDKITRVRCNDCMTIMEEDADHQVTECSECGRDDCLMVGFDEDVKEID